MALQYGSIDVMDLFKTEPLFPQGGASAAVNAGMLGDEEWGMQLLGEQPTAQGASCPLPPSIAENDSAAPLPTRKRRMPSNKPKTERTEEARRRNRMHARNSRLRKKLYVDSLKQSISKLQEENAQLRASLAQSSNEAAVIGLLDENLGGGLEPAGKKAKIEPKSIAGGDFMLIQALSTSSQSFVISDPNTLDNPIVYASNKFFELTGYSRSEVIGRNCRFLQGPETDPRTIAKISKAVQEAKDVHVVVKNYCKDGTPFWNRVFIAPLCNDLGNVVNFIAVQSMVSEEMVNAIEKLPDENPQGSP